MVPTFVDREIELEELRALARRPGPHLALLYGRRRIGKTFLLDHAWDEEQRFYFLAADTTPEQNRVELLRELSGWAGGDFEPEDHPSWRTVFRLFGELAANRPLVVVLDEFQYLMGSEEGVVSQLNAVWDREVAGRDLTMVLSGSQVSTMAALEAGDSPLYGRVDWRRRLRGFDYLDAARMLPEHWSLRDRTYGYGIFGGTPRYLAAIDPEENLDEAVVRTFLSPRGEIHLQLEHLVDQEQGIRSPGEYRAVLTAVAGGRTGISEIADLAGLGDRRHVVTRALDTLEDLELVRRERNFGAGRTTPWRFVIADNAVRFWYRFVHPNRSRLETVDPAAVWERQVRPHLDTAMGSVFERVARQAFERFHSEWGLPDVDRWDRWEGQDRNRRPIEIDLVAELDDGRLLPGEVKWSGRPVGAGIHRDLSRDLEDLSRSGRAWAHRALDPERSAGRLYVSAGGFDEIFRDLADERPGVRLIALEDLYREP